MRRSSSSLLLVLPLLAVIFFLRTRNAPHAIQHNDRPQDSSTQGPSRNGTVRPPESCSALNLTCSSQYFSQWRRPSDNACSSRISNGYPVPDPSCTPGGSNPSVTEATLGARDWTTKCLRDCESTESQKHAAYYWYSQPRPQSNNGPTQVCELDHLVPLNLGGADGMGNIWPECGPDGVQLDERYFKKKDEVEDYLVNQVRTGRMHLIDAQRGIAQNWPQYMTAADEYCHSGGHCS